RVRAEQSALVARQGRARAGARRRARGPGSLARAAGSHAVPVRAAKGERGLGAAWRACRHRAPALRCAGITRCRRMEGAKGRRAVPEAARAYGVLVGAFVGGAEKSTFGDSPLPGAAA